MMNIEIVKKDRYLITSGLKELKGFELRLIILEWSESDYKEVLRYVCNYISESNKQIQDEETMSYYSWLLQFKSNTLGVIDLWEVNSDGSGFSEGVDFAIKVIKEQVEECRNRNVIPNFPTFSQKIVISQGVYEGYGVDAVRYSSPDHMTGWWVTTSLYDDNIDSLMTVHFYHVAFKRPDILRYFALPFGYRFYIDSNETDVWFDKEVLSNG